MTSRLDTTERARIDKWLWATRFYKTRQLAIKALKSGKIHLNKQACKPASLLKVGDLVCVKRGVYEIEVEILGLTEKRGSATVAQTMYRETQASKNTREILQEQIANQPKIDFGHRKPDKRNVRQQRAVKRGE